jgi:hypothetical protein
MLPLFAAREERVKIHVGDPAMWRLRACHVLSELSHSGRRYIVKGESGQIYFSGRTTMAAWRWRIFQQQDCVITSDDGYFIR